MSDRPTRVVAQSSLILEFDLYYRGVSKDNMFVFAVDEEADLRVLLPGSDGASFAELRAFRTWRPGDINVTTDLVTMTEGTDSYCTLAWHIRQIRRVKLDLYNG